MVHMRESTGAGAVNAEDERTQRRRMAAVWAAAGSAVAATVATTWLILARNGGRPIAGDSIGRGATAEWLRTLPWWDWRGWSDWFYGGQAVGVNYPPLGHAWLRFTHPGHGQMVAVTVVLLVLLPWGTWRLGRAVGLAPRAQRAAVGAVLVLVAAAGNMDSFLPGFHQVFGFFDEWPAATATVLGLFCAAWAARCERPLVCGAVAGVALLFNPTVVPGIAVVCAVLLMTAGATRRQVASWTATAITMTLAVCAWWLVPFVAGWDRLAPSGMTLPGSLGTVGILGTAIFAALAMGVGRALLAGPVPARRLAIAAAAGVIAGLLGDLSGSQRAERWLVIPILVAAAAAGSRWSEGHPRRPPRPVWAVLGSALALALIVVTRRFELAPLAVWMLWWPQRAWVTAGALAWAAVLLYVPLWEQMRSSPSPDRSGANVMAIAAAQASPDAAGLVYLDESFNLPPGDAAPCPWDDPWLATVETGGRLRPLAGLYRETSTAAEFLDAGGELRTGRSRGGGELRPHWSDAWVETGARPLDTPAAAACARRPLVRRVRPRRQRRGARHAWHDRRRRDCHPP